MNQEPFKEFTLIEPPRKRRVRLILFIVGAILVAGVTLFIRFSRESDVLEADIRFDGYQFHITNNERAPLTGLEVVVNHRYSPQWKSPPPQAVAPGHTIQVPLAWFQRRDGVRFYLTDQVRYLLIRATVKGRRKSLLRAYL
jgi:hypothetical protein